MEIEVFNQKFSTHEKKLKGYLHRLFTNRQDVDDFHH